MAEEHGRRRWTRWLAAVIGVVLVAFGALFLILRTPDTDPAQMVARYARPTDIFLPMGEGARLHVRDSGREDPANMAKPVLVLIHGTASSLQTWEPLAQRLGGQWRIVTLDLPGHGLTGAVPGSSYDTASLVAAVNRAVEGLGISRFVLGGNSLGGLVAWRYALAHPDEVEALVLLDAGGMPPRPGDAPPRSNIGFRLARNPVGAWLMERITPRSLVRRSVEQTVADPRIVTDAMVDRYWELLRYPGNRHAMTLRFQQPFIDTAAAEQARNIRVPTLIIFGRQDRLVNPSAAQSFAERIAGSEVVMMDHVGHLPMEEAPDATAQAINDFLTRRLAPTH